MVDKHKAKQQILIFRYHLLKLSENFIKNQAENFSEFKPFYAGARLVHDIKLPEERTIVINKFGRYGKFLELPFKIFGISPVFYHRLSKVNPVLIHAHFGTDGVMALPIKKKLNVPLVVTFHGFDITVHDEYAKKSFYIHRKLIENRQTLIDSADLFIAVSEFIKQKMVSKGFPAEKIVVHHIGVNTDFFIPDPEITREPIVLFVGRLSRNKGCKYLIRAMEMVQKKVPAAKLVVIGDGEEKNELMRLADSKLINYNFLGAVSQSVVKYWMNKSKVFCVPSVQIDCGASEAFGMVFLEAQSMKVPVVSFKTGGIPEAVNDQNTGLLYNQKDFNGLTDGIIKFLDSESVWKAYSRKGRNFIKQNFDIRSQSNKLQVLYRKLIQKNIN